MNGSKELIKDLIGNPQLAEAAKGIREKLRKEKTDHFLTPSLDEMNPQDKAMRILKDPELFKKITLREFDKQIVGELETRKVIFLCTCGRLVINCQTSSFNLLVNDEAGSGKDYVVGAVLKILPKESYVQKTRISPAAFTYWHNSDNEPEWTWDGKVYYAEDISESVLNSDVFKVMCSNGSSATIVVKQMAHDIEIKGKPVIITTTASAIPNAELVRRFTILNLDSSINQTKAIMQRHSKYKQEGIVPEYNQDYTKSLGYLARVKVKIPFAERIANYFPSENIIMRTHYPRFLDFICASAAFHQYQRQIDEEGFVLANEQDYDIARESFLKLMSNRYMIPLTLNQKKILSVFEIDSSLTGSVTQLRAKMNFLSIPALQTNLSILTKYGILETSIKEDSLNRDMEIFSIAKNYNLNTKLELPTYNELSNLSKLSNSETVENSVIKDIKDIKAEEYNPMEQKT